MSRFKPPDHFSASEKRDFNWFIEATSGRSAYNVARALNRLNLGCDWRGVGKTGMAEAFALRNCLVCPLLAIFLRDRTRAEIARALKFLDREKVCA